MSHDSGQRHADSVRIDLDPARLERSAAAAGAGTRPASRVELTPVIRPSRDA